MTMRDYVDTCEYVVVYRSEDGTRHEARFDTPRAAVAVEAALRECGMSAWIEVDSRR
jgi:hypothetical protein